MTRTGVFSGASGSFFSSTIIEAAVATGFDAVGALPGNMMGSALSLAEKPKERKAGSSVHAPRNGQVVQRREGLWLHLSRRWQRRCVRAPHGDSRQRI